MEVTYDDRCFGCGRHNPDGLRMRFEPEDGQAVTEFVVPPRYQGWAGIVHGGLVALMLDEAVGWAAWHAGHPGVTGKLDVRLRLPLKVGERVRVVGRVESVRRTLVYTSAFIERLADGARVAEATATLAAVDPTVASGASPRAR
ncbi:MAG TPA: PaaI family thioesterase [Candidatus Acidoferrales bacterium]|nr:PaaI family thioesterase [Candidatus Acidoferrales bacterium]